MSTDTRKIGYPPDMHTSIKRGISDNIFPRGFVANALQKGQDQFLNSFRDTRLLLFRLQSPDENLIPDLFQEHTEDVSRQRLHFQYRTSAGDVAREENVLHIPLVGQEELRIRRALSEGPHFVAPLKKHIRSGPSFPERITVGRALNQDLVIEHPSISKIQAWFEIDDRGVFFLSDAGSTNGTAVNSRAISPRRRFKLNAGDNIRFASVEAIFCRPEVLWDVMCSTSD